VKTKGGRKKQECVLIKRKGGGKERGKHSKKKLAPIPSIMVGGKRTNSLPERGGRRNGSNLSKRSQRLALFIVHAREGDDPFFSLGTREKKIHTAWQHAAIQFVQIEKKEKVTGNLTGGCQGRREGKRVFDGGGKERKGTTPSSKAHKGDEGYLSVAALRRGRRKTLGNNLSAL